MSDFFEDLRERILGSPFHADGVAALSTLVRPVPPFKGFGGPVVAFGSLVLFLASIAFALFSLAGLLWAMFTAYVIATKVFGIQIDLPDEAFAL